MGSYDNIIKTRYMFLKQNIELDTIKMINELWTRRYAYFMIIIESIDTKNRIHFDNIPLLSPSSMRELVSLFKKKWYILKLKLKGDSVKTFYLNPLYAHRGQSISKELFDAFDKINWGKIY